MEQIGSGVGSDLFKFFQDHSALLCHSAGSVGIHLGGFLLLQLHVISNKLPYLSQARQEISSFEEKTISPVSEALVNKRMSHSIISCSSASFLKGRPLETFPPAPTLWLRLFHLGNNVSSPAHVRSPRNKGKTAHTWPGELLSLMGNASQLLGTKIAPPNDVGSIRNYREFLCYRMQSPTYHTGVNAI
jgi:hypothetical protein